MLPIKQLAIGSHWLSW